VTKPVLQQLVRGREQSHQRLSSMVVVFVEGL
jgi:hypothetical protein